MIVDFGFDLAGRREPRLWRGLAYGVAAAAAEAVPYLVLLHALTAVFEGGAGPLLALGTALVLLAAFAAQVTLKARANIENFGGAYGLVADARLAVADGLSRLPMGVFTRNRRAVVAELLTGRFGLYQDVVSQVWGLVVANAALPVFLALILAAVDWRVAVLAVAFVPVAALAIPWSHRLLARAAERLAGLREDLVTGLLDQIEGVRDLRHYDRERLRRRQLEEALAVFERAQIGAELAPAPALLAFAFLLHLGFAATALAAALLAGPEAGSPAGLVLLLVLGLRFYRAVLDLGLNLAEARFARETLARIRALAAEPPLPEPVGGHTPPPTPPSSWKTCPSPMRRGARRPCMASTVSSRPARWWRWSARPARGNRRWPISWGGCGTWAAARSASAGWTCARWPP